jgi:hypothetical protein
MVFRNSDAQNAMDNLKKRYGPYTIQTANAFIKKIAEAPQQALVCNFSIQNVPESAVHIMLEAVAYLLYTKGHRLAYKITLTQTSTDTPDDTLLEAENNRTFNASIRVHILTKEYIANQNKKPVSKIVDAATPNTAVNPATTDANVATGTTPATTTVATPAEEYVTPNGEGFVLGNSA